MARASKKKAKPARKRAASRRKTVIEQSQNSWQIGAGIFALAALLGAGAYMISTNLDTSTTVAQLVERFEVPQAVTETESGPIESAPAR